MSRPGHRGAEVFGCGGGSLKVHPKGYEPVTKEHMQALLAMLPRLELTDFIFLDFGSGKGRALFVAAEHPFRQIIGVEYSRELHETAMRNVHTYRNPAQKCFNITPVRADATTFSLPEFPTICFMNNPYDETLVTKTAQYVHQSLRSAPRPFFIIYMNAYYTRPFDTPRRVDSHMLWIAGKIILHDLEMERERH